MKVLTIFILGIVFIQWCIPIGDSLIELIVTLFESWKGKLGLKISKINAEINKLSEDTEIEHSLIGFQVDTTSEEEDDNEYED